MKLPMIILEQMPMDRHEIIVDMFIVHVVFIGVT